MAQRRLQHCGAETRRSDALSANMNGFGITRVLQGGKLLEKAAANVSIVKGTLTAARAQVLHHEVACSVPLPGNNHVDIFTCVGLRHKHTDSPLPRLAAPAGDERAWP